MSVIKIQSDRGNERVFVRMTGIEQATRRGIRLAWFDLGRDLKSEANREILRRPKSGRTYIVRSRSGGRRRHVASAPGETHANLTGRLRRSISWKVHGTDSMDFGYGASTTLRTAAPRYSPFVEFGTRRMDERPSLENAINVTQREAEQNFERAITREILK